MNKIIFAMVFAIVFLPASFNVFAQYAGPSSLAVLKSVTEVLKDPVDDQPVVLTGHLIKQVGKEKYLFRDATGEIRVEIEREDLPKTSFDENTRLELNGEVEKDFLQSPEIDVDLVRIL